MKNLKLLVALVITTTMFVSCQNEEVETTEALTTNFDEQKAVATFINDNNITKDSKFDIDGKTLSYLDVINPKAFGKFKEKFESSYTLLHLDNIIYLRNNQEKIDALITNPNHKAVAFILITRGKLNVTMELNTAKVIKASGKRKNKTPFKILKISTRGNAKMNNATRRDTPLTEFLCGQRGTIKHPGIGSVSYFFTYEDGCK
jgi:hypothetical protein